MADYDLNANTIFIFFCLECPTPEIKIYRSSDSKLLFSANVTMKKATIPFATIERQEVHLITDPKNKTRMPWESSASISGGEVFFAMWEKDNDYQSHKVISKLPIDQDFKTIERIYGSIKQNGVSNKERYITHDCPLEPTNTNKWQCLKTAKMIESDQVCNGHNDCCDKHDDCWDESDEDPERCKGTNNKLIVVSKFVNITVLVLGYILCAVYFPINAFNKKWTSVNTINKGENDCTTVTDLDPETFKSIFSVCKKFQNWNNTNTGKSPERFDFIDISKKYRLLLETKDFEQIRAIKSCLMNLSLFYSFKYTSMAIAEHLITLEHEDLHVAGNSETADQCIKKTMTGYPKAAEFFIQSKERNDFLSRVKRNIRTRLSMNFYINTIISLTILTTIVIYAIDTIIPYYDSHLDASLSIALHHIETFFITSDSKEQEIGFISLTITKYYYYLISILSTICISALFYANLSVLKQNRESLLFSGSEFGMTKIGKIMSFLPIVFPYHFMAMEYVRLKYRSFKRTQKITTLLEELMAKESLDDITENLDQFMTLQNELQEMENYELELRRIIIASFMTNLLIEGMPQFIVMSSLLVTELGNESGFGKLRAIFENVLKEYIGIPGKTSYIIMLVLQIIKIDFSLTTILSSKTHGIGSGMVASVIKVLGLLFMVTAKLILLTIQLYQAPYIISLVTIAEFAIALLYCKITQESVSLFHDVIPITITPALHLTTKGNVLRRKERTMSTKFSWLLVRWNGTINVVVLHFANLLLIYIPLKFALPFLQPTVEKEWEMKFVYAMLGYILSLVPFLCLEFAFSKFGRRWRLLESGLNDTNDSKQMEMTKTNVDGDEIKGYS